MYCINEKFFIGKIVTFFFFLSFYLKNFRFWKEFNFESKINNDYLRNKFDIFAILWKISSTMIVNTLYCNQNYKCLMTIEFNCRIFMKMLCHRSCSINFKIHEHFSLIVFFFCFRINDVSFETNKFNKAFIQTHKTYIKSKTI